MTACDRASAGAGGPASVERLPGTSADSMRRALARADAVRVLVVGDVMLDRFVFGHVTRISPEAPVPVVRADREIQRPGGAANVARGVVALGAQAQVIGAIGRDGGGDMLVQLCRRDGFSAELSRDPQRRTTAKVRIATERNQQVARVGLRG